ncbi:alcohol dehydrogenase catalytic domain-containing protein [Flavobacterium sp. J27]|uniref:alcohol dehydrogenase catalytic domain-containing protein n=1 Tax=Flavobacterium sp. J27 TaxID=2060419 RepID=UPI00197AFD3E|nr:alcohol dehydrogenase catalytic domain-containing protein [Flavobacterium sp. J27]
MKVIIIGKYGPPEVLKFDSVRKLVPKDDEVLIRINAIPVSTEDPLQRMGKPYFTRLFLGLTKPKKSVLGAEFSGQIEAIGKNVTLFNIGDSVFGHSGSNLGCYAEYVYALHKTVLY